MNSQTKLLLGGIAVVGIILILTGERQASSNLRRENQNLRLQLDQQSNQVLQLSKELKTIRSRGASTTKEIADISYNFPGIPVEQIFSIYENLCGKKLIIDPKVDLPQRVRIITQHRLTKNEAMRVIEQALREQTHVIVVAEEDGNLSVVPDPMGIGKP